MQRPRIKVHPVNNLADYKIAQVIEGMTRHIEVNSNADTAYDTAFDYAVRMGWGYWRVNTRMSAKIHSTKKSTLTRLTTRLPCTLTPIQHHCLMVQMLNVA
jgi:hypothetical protein